MWLPWISYKYNRRSITTNKIIKYYGNLHFPPCSAKANAIYESWPKSEFKQIFIYRNIKIAFAALVVARTKLFKSAVFMILVSY